MGWCSTQPCTPNNNDNDSDNDDNGGVMKRLIIMAYNNMWNPCAFTDPNAADHKDVHSLFLIPF